MKSYYMASFNLFNFFNVKNTSSFSLMTAAILRLWTSSYNLAKSPSMTASWVNKSTSTRAHWVVCERHEVQSRRLSQDWTLRPSHTTQWARVCTGRFVHPVMLLTALFLLTTDPVVVDSNPDCVEVGLHGFQNPHNGYEYWLLYPGHNYRKWLS